MSEWIDQAEVFSLTSKEYFQQWAKVIDVCLAKAQLQEETYCNVQTRINDGEKRKAESRHVIQKGGVMTIEEAQLKLHEKEVKQKSVAIKRYQKNIQVAVNRAKVVLNRWGISARKAEREIKKQIHNIQVQGGIISFELLIAIPDPEKNLTAANLKSLQASPELL